MGNNTSIQENKVTFYCSKYIDDYELLLLHIKYLYHVKDEDMKMHEMSDIILYETSAKEFIKEYLKKINKIDYDEQIMIYLKTFYESKKMSLNIFCFNLQDIIIISFEKNLQNEIKYKISKIKPNDDIEYENKLNFSKNMLKKLSGKNNADIEIIINDC